MNQDDIEFQNFARIIARRESRKYLQNPPPPTGFDVLPEPPDYDALNHEAMETQQ